MDQKKIGGFLKELRKEKGITQEQFAEILGVSGRTVSRWETGSNMPDLDVLIQIADYYDVEIREMLNGERKSESMNREMEETALMVADYSNEEKQKLSKRMCILFIIGTISFTVYLILKTFYKAENPFGDFLTGFMLGFSYGMMILGVLYTSGYLAKFRAFKMKLFRRN